MQSVLTTLGFILSFVLHASVPDGIVKGKVFDKNTGEPLAGVYVIYGKNAGTTSEQDGSYIIKAEQGKLNITFQFIGYESVARDIFLTDNDTTELDIRLEMKVREIDQVVVSANRTEQRIAELSVSTDIIKTSYLTENHITDAQELINKTSGIEVMDGQASVRGGSGYSYGAGSRVLALIDGLPVVAADAGNIKWQFLPLENLSQIEIIKGASSVLYGSSALNGVINFRTADATNTPVTQFYTEVGTFGKPANHDWIWWSIPRKFSSTSISHLQKFGRTDFGISGNIMVDEGYRRFNDETLGRISLKLKRFSRPEGLNYGINLNAGYNVRTDFLLWENADNGALKQSASTALEYHGTIFSADPFISLKKSSRYQHDLRMRIQSSFNRLPESEQNNGDAYSVYTEYQLWYRLFDFIDLTAGVSENYNKVKSNLFGNHYGLNIAGFTQLEIRPIYRLKAVAGLRIENYSLDGIYDKVVPILRAGINWQAADYTFLRASFGQGYRFPAIAEKFAATTVGSIKIIANPDLLPESGWSTELGLKQGLAFGKLTGQADISLFLMQNSKLIEFYFSPSYEEGIGFKATNIEMARIYGTEIEFVLNQPIGVINLSANGGYTFVYPVEFNRYTHRNTDEFLKYRRMHSGKLYVNSKWKRFDLGLNLGLRSKILNIDEVFRNPVTGEQFLPGFPGYWQEHNTGYMTIDAIVGYRINDRLTMSCAVKNLSNTEYMGRPGDIQPHRNYSLRFSGKF